jgi:hypothetical protein
MATIRYSISITSFRGAVAPARVGALTDREVRRWRLSSTARDVMRGTRPALPHEVVDLMRIHSASSALR